MAHKLFLSGNPQFSWTGAQIQDHTACLEISSSLCADNEKIVFFADRRRCGPFQLHCGMAGCVLPEPLHQVLAAVHNRAGIIPDFIGIVDTLSLIHI